MFVKCRLWILRQQQGAEVPMTTKVDLSLRAVTVLLRKSDTCKQVEVSSPMQQPRVAHVCSSSSSSSTTLQGLAVSPDSRRPRATAVA